MIFSLDADFEVAAEFNVRYRWIFETQNIFEDHSVVLRCWIWFSHVHTRIFFVVRALATLPRRAAGTHVKRSRLVVRHLALNKGVAVIVNNGNVLPVPVVGIGIYVRLAASVIRPAVRLRRRIEFV